jgi:hypothetical protein
MSRKRDEKRDKERALARQLGVKKDAIPHELIAKPRTTALTVRPGEIVVDKEPFALFARERPSVVVGLFLRSPDGVVAVLDGVLRAPAIKKGERSPLAALDSEMARAMTKVHVTHHRPAHLVLTAALIASERDARALAGALRASPPRVVVEGVSRTLDDDTLARRIGAGPFACTIEPTAEHAAAGTAAAIVLLPAAGTGKHAITCVLATTDDKWRATVTLTVIE